MTRRFIVFVPLLALGGWACEAGGGGDGVHTGQAPPAAPQAEETIAPSGPDPISAATDPSATSVRLTVRVSRTGATQVIDAVELPGILKQERDMTREALYEARDAKGVVAVQGVDLDFEERPLGAGRQHGETRLLDEQIIHVDLPGISLERARGLSVRLSRITGKLQDKVATRSTFERLTQQGMLQPFGELRPAQLDAAIRSRARRISRTPAPLIGQ